MPRERAVDLLVASGDPEVRLLRRMALCPEYYFLDGHMAVANG